jgi:hypothetical protein
VVTALESPSLEQLHAVMGLTSGAARHQHPADLMVSAAGRHGGGGGRQLALQAPHSSAVRGGAGVLGQAGARAADALMSSAQLDSAALG